MRMSEMSKIAELFRLADDLESIEKTEENYRILSDVYSHLDYYRYVLLKSRFVRKDGNRMYSVDRLFVKLVIN